MQLIRRLGGFLIDVIQTVVLALAIFLIVYLFLLQPHQVRGQSMDPSFSDGEYLLTDKLSYRFGQPKRGDVVVFAAPPNEKEDFIKRIVGLPGERVGIRDGKVYINGEVISEGYLAQDTLTPPGSFLEEGKEVTIAAGEYFVIGDNRLHSSDSRAWGPVPKKNLVGRAWFVYWPPQEIRLVPQVSFAR